jgi:microsomal dipeptidase-like Zn-dependent dipeptidase
MYNLNRKQFLNRAALLWAGATFLPKIVWAGTLPELKAREMDYRIIDLHCHPSLKMYLWNQHLWKRHLPGPGANEIQMQDDLHQLGFGHIKGLVAAHYLVEASAIREWNVLKKLFPWINRLLHGLADKIEHEDASNFTQINIMIDLLEQQVHLANERQKYVTLVIARDYQEFLNTSEKPNHIAIAHAIEGGHALGRHFVLSEKRKQQFSDHGNEQNQMVTAEMGTDPASHYVRNLEALAGRGVCMLTIAHIFKNDLAHPVEGISDDKKKSLGMEWHYQAEDDNCDLSEIGIAVAKRMLELGMVIDLTHSTPAARRNVFEINQHITASGVGRLPRPLAFTHVGLQSVFEKYNHVPELQSYKFYDIDEEEILAICACDGVIGVIPENFWLTGVDPKIKRPGIEGGNYRYGINFIIETMCAINEKTTKKDFSNIAIGTDFDGYADAPKDLYVPEQLGDLVDAIKKIKGILSKQVEAITSGNARRLLERGWGNPIAAVNIPPVTMVGTCAEKINRVY